MAGEHLSPRAIEDRWRRKTPGLESDHDIIPPSRTWEELVHKTTAELQAEYPVRYRTYMEVLHGQRHLEDDVDMVRWLGMMNRLDRHIAEEHAGDNPTLEGDQLDVFQDIRKHYEQGETEGFIVLPTGVGKTVIFVELAEAFNCKTLVVVPTQELTDQTRDEFNKFAPDLSVGLYYSDEKQLDRQVTVTTYDSLANLIATGKLDPNSIDLLVLDEAHRALTKRRGSIIEQFKRSMKLGVTATDAYAEDKQVSMLLQHEFHRMRIGEAIKRALLCNTAAAIVKTDIDLSGVPIVDGRYDSEQLEDKYNTPGLNQATVDLYKKRHMGERAMGFCTGVKHARTLAEKFQRDGILAAAVWGGMPKQERRDLIAAHRSGELLVLTNDQVLREGYNVPEASVCFNLDPTGSLVNATQRGGRVTRLDRNRPDKLATVYDFLPQRDPRKSSVLFSQVLGGAVVLQQHAPDSKGGQSRPTPPDHEPDPDIPGIKVVYDADEVMRITQEYKEGKKEITQEDIRAALREQGTTARNWIGLSLEGKRAIEVQGLKLIALATIFGIVGDARVDRVFIQLCRAIFGDADVDTVLAEVGVTPDKIRETLKRQGVTAKDWVVKESAAKKEIEVHGLKLTALATIFGITGNPVGYSEIFIQLCRAIFGDTEVDAALQEIGITPDKIREAIRAQGISAKDWMSMMGKDRRKIEILGLGIASIAAVFNIEGNVGGNSSDLELLCRAIFGDTEVDAALQEIGITPDKIREAIRAQGISAKDWVVKSSSERRKIEIYNLKLVAVSKIFGFLGDPTGNTAVFMQLCRAIFGDMEVDQAIQEFLITPDKIRLALDVKGETAKGWVNKTKREKTEIKVCDLTLRGIASIFGITGDPLYNVAVYHELCRAIFGYSEVDKALRETAVTPDTIRSALRAQKVTAKDWLGKTRRERSEIKIQGLKLVALVTIFGLDFDSLDNTEQFVQLCRVIFSDSEVDKALRETAVTPDTIRSALRAQKVTAKDWLQKTSTERLAIEVKGIKLTAIANLFGIQGNPKGNTDLWVRLCRVVFGDVAVDAALQEIVPTPDTIRATLRTQRVTAKNWLQKTRVERTAIEVNGLKVFRIARLFNISSDPLGYSEVFIQLCRAIFGDVEVDTALRELGK